MLKADFTRSFARDRKKSAKKHWDVAALDAALEAVVHSDETPMSHTYNDHALTGDLVGCRALHIGGRSSNWVLVYELDEDTVYFIRTGTHDEVYG
ncbi:MAG: type II toxin-antitoxin system YafQ family toxin [Propionibacteriaceae bacterium]|nr:type II toxin-antitoxin system YafQ family toxin [Propionibacteriaceae bacterium]